MQCCTIFGAKIQIFDNFFAIFETENQMIFESTWTAHKAIYSITQNVELEFLNFGIFYQFLINQNCPVL